MGIGSRGTWLLRLLLEQKGVEIRAVCDLIPDRVAKAQEMVTAAKQAKPTGYTRGETADKSRPQDFPDFTRGRWKTTRPIGILGS